MLAGSQQAASKPTNVSPGGYLQRIATGLAWFWRGLVGIVSVCNGLVGLAGECVTGALLCVHRGREKSRPLAIQAMITTTLIAIRCRQEKILVGNDDRQSRIAELENQLDANAFETRCQVQLACEAIKFHMIRLAGFDFESALSKMGVA